MRHRRSTLIAILVAAATLAAQQPNDVTSTLLAQQDAWNAGNLAAYVNFYKPAPDSTALLGAPIRGLQSIYNAYLLTFPNPASMGKLQESDITVRPLGENFALATGKYLLTRDKKLGGVAYGAFTDILERTPKGWRIIYSSNS